MVAGTLVLEPNVDWTLTNIDGIRGGQVVFADDLTEDPVAFSNFWYGVGTPANSYLTLRGETYTFTADADGAGNPGFLAQP